MTDYRAALDALDVKAGRIHTLADCAVAYQKSIETPERLTDKDLVLIGFVHGDTGVSEARLRQMQATAMAEPQAPMATKSAERKAPAMTKAALEALVGGFITGMKPIFESYKAKISALETRNANLEERCAALEVRVLELEAQDAARLVPHVDR